MATDALSHAATVPERPVTDRAHGSDTVDERTAFGASVGSLVMRVFVTHNPEDLTAYYGRALPDLDVIAEVVLNPLGRDLTTAELIEAADGCDVIVAHRSTPGPAELFGALPQLLALLRTAVDVSTIDIDAASHAGVVVARAGKSFVASTAELALALALDLARNVSASTVDYQRNAEPPQRPGFQLGGKTAGIIGYGAIGRYLANLLTSLGLEVLVHDPFVSFDEAPDLGGAGGITRAGFDELLAASHLVFPLAASTPETIDLIDARALATMRPGALLINVSRGELLDEQAVAAALDSGHLGGLAIDVGRAPDQRPSPELAGRQGVVATPHLGGLTPENADAQAASSVEQVQAMLAGEMPPRSVNPDDATRLRAWWQR
jgi:D-3-phosphoglycerate dehydrogenase